MSDQQILQRERKQGVAGWLSLSAYLVVAGLAAALIALVAWVLLRLERGTRRMRPALRVPSLL